MARVLPFKATRFDTAAGADLTGRIAPPYDVLSEADKQAMLGADPHNIVAIDLPHTPPKSLGPAGAYARSARLLDEWLAAGVLIRDAQPAVYAYQQVFTQGDRRYVRRGFIARVRLEEFSASETGIFPHEQTFSGPKEDRLALTRATQAQLSPIFGIFPDADNRVTDGLYANLPAAATMHGRLGEVTHQAWRVADAAKIAALTAGMSAAPIFIADGHHRYTTALNYMKQLQAAGPLADDDPARFVMFVCISMYDPGLVIFPTHRVATLHALSLEPLADRLAGAFDVQPTSTPVEQLERQVLAAGVGTFAIKTSASDAGLILRLRDKTVLGSLAPNRSAAFRQLDVAILHRFILDEVVVPQCGAPLAMEYPHSGADVSAALASRADSAAAFGGSAASASASAVKAAFLVAPTPLAAVRDICLAGELMPQKSTFFYPKLATGLAIYQHRD